MTARLPRPKLGGAVYILPNLITSGNLFFGFYCIVKSLQGDLRGAALAILLASVFDVLDGRVARLTGGTSEFGIQYDSLCDLVSFGLGPSILMYQAGLGGLGRLGWAICFLFLACGALRLARFNVQSAIGKASGDFTGLPIPMAAAVIATFLLVATNLADADVSYVFIQKVVEIVTDVGFRIGFLVVAGIGLALAMVSNIGYRSHKAFKIRGVKPFKLLVCFIIIIGLVWYQPEILGFVFFLAYALSGPVEWILGWRKAHEDDDIFAQEDEETGDGNGD